MYFPPSCAQATRVTSLTDKQFALVAVQTFAEKVAKEDNLKRILMKCTTPLVALAVICNNLLFY
jgi:hypothetical protein